MFDLNDAWPDSEIWQYAREQKLTIVTKDADFSTLAILNEPPPWVIHLRIGNMTIRNLHTFRMVYRNDGRAIKMLDNIVLVVIVVSAGHNPNEMYAPQLFQMRLAIPAMRKLVSASHIKR